MLDPEPDLIFFDSNLDTVFWAALFPHFDSSNLPSGLSLGVEYIYIPPGRLDLSSSYRVFSGYTGDDALISMGAATVYHEKLRYANIPKSSVATAPVDFTWLVYVGSASPPPAVDYTLPVSYQDWIRWDGLKVIEPLSGVTVNFSTPPTDSTNASATFADLLADIAQFVGWGRNPDNWNVEDRLTILRSIQAAGIRKAVNPPPLPGQRLSHEWSWLKPVIPLTTQAPYITGTVTVASGVVTLSGGTFPSWAASGEFIVNGVSYSIDSRVSGTQINLNDTSVNYSAGTSYQLGQAAVPLPDNFGGLFGPITFRPGTSTMWPPLEVTGEWNLRNAAQSDEIIARPRYAAQHQADQTGNSYELLLWPIPDAAYELRMRIKINFNSLDDSTTLPGGPSFVDVLRESCLAEAEIRMEDRRGSHWEAFMEALAAAISTDIESLSPEYLGIDHDRSDGMFDSSMAVNHYLSDNIVTYNGLVPS